VPFSRGSDPCIKNRLAPWRGLPGRIRVETRCALKPEDRGTDTRLITGGFGVVLGIEAADPFGDRADRRRRHRALRREPGGVRRCGSIAPAARCSNHPASPAKHRHYGTAR
jgi:hypothetical protein